MTSATWTDPVDRADGYTVGATVWNQSLGDTGNMQYLYDALKEGFAAQLFTEGGVHKQLCSLGPAPVGINYPSLEPVGVGFGLYRDSTSAAHNGVTTAGADQGAWDFSTGATSGEDCGVVGPSWAASTDWTLVWRGRVPASANQTIVIGAKTSAGFADENDMIAFRISGTGNVVGVCDSGGTETTRDTSADGSTELTLRIEVRSGGTIVRFYKNGTQVGDDVTTNIPTGTLRISCGIVNSTTADKDMYTHDLFCWREV